MLRAGYSHGDCMEGIGLENNVGIPKFWGDKSFSLGEETTPNVSSVKKSIKLKKRRMEGLTQVNVLARKNKDSKQ